MRPKDARVEGRRGGFLEYMINMFVFAQVKSGSIFDNLLITDNVKEAEEFGKATWELHR